MGFGDLNLSGSREHVANGVMSMPASAASKASRKNARSAPLVPELGQFYSEEFALGSLDEFADACDKTRNAAAATRLLVGAARRQGFEKIIVVSHLQPDQVSSFSVRVHNCDAPVIDHFLSSPSNKTNAILSAVNRGNDLVQWDDRKFRTKLGAGARVWLQRLEALGLKGGVSQRIRTALVPASCSLTLARAEVDEAAIRWVMRAGAYVFHHVIMLQRPQLAPSAVLTFREHQCLALASLAGLRPREVAIELGVSVNTVRSIRQRACARLGARSQEEAVWRMVETGQLFLPGRLSKPRR